jgi:Tfp pilus assembly protein PilF
VGSEGDKESYEPAPFTPLIVGVPSDPLSQGRALLERGYLSEAIAELSVAAVTGQSLAEANNLLGLAYDRQGRHKEANEAFERALSSAPADPHLLNNLGYSLYLNGYYVAAVVRLRQAARLAPGNPHVLNNLALVYGRLRKYDEAFKHYTRAGGELYARLQTGALLDFAGRDRDAIKQFEAARRLDPASTEALRRLIKLYNRTGQRDKAEAARQELDRPKAKSSAASS